MTKHLSVARTFSVAAALATLGTAHASTFTTLHLFTGTDGATPNELIQGADGNYYGSTSAGGNHDNGEVFKMTPAGAVTVLYVFNGTSGSRPLGALAAGGDGYYYGTTSNGGSLSGGTAFKISPSGALTFLHQFGAAGEGQNPTGLISGNDGNFYGTTYFGGAGGVGTLFKMTPAGVVTTLHSFTGADGSMPMDQLRSAGDGSYYGLSANGGAANCGTFYRITNDGTFSLLYSFPNAAPAGCKPQGRLVDGAGGDSADFFGTTQSGGANSAGTVFRITRAGVPSWLHSFAGTADGATPHGGLTLANNLSFYGTTGSGGAYGVGVTFKISSTGSYTLLHSLNPAVAGETTGPHAPLLLDSAGNLIGSTPGYSSSTTGGSVFSQTP